LVDEVDKSSDESEKSSKSFRDKLEDIDRGTYDAGPVAKVRPGCAFFSTVVEGGINFSTLGNASDKVETSVKLSCDKLEDIEGDAGGARSFSGMASMLGLEEDSSVIIFDCIDIAQENVNNPPITKLKISFLKLIIICSYSKDLQDPLR
jgi:hypothetical protein